MNRKITVGESIPDVPVTESQAVVAPTTPTAPTAPPGPPPNSQLQNLLGANVTTPNAAFNVIIGFVGLAQGRGAYSLQEAAKIFECIKMFRIDNQPTPSQ